ncbi:MAG: N-acetylmannosamine-6-phosphate 2-epimerase [Propionibacterium sp.]|nr:MAG: N-acetylmannosamine-6-phosphate 2-epimerase [Propionibacterium sp.]
MDTSSTIDRLKNGVVVSCQAYPGEPMLDPKTMTQIAQSAVAGGAAGIRAKGLADLHMMRDKIDVPIIGIVKVGKTGVFITPTLKDCLEVAGTGCEIVALDGTRRERPDGLTLAETVAGLKDKFPDVLVMADCGSKLDAEAAKAAGCDILSSTLVGYSGERPKTEGPDWEAIDQIVAVAENKPVLVEGRVHSPADVAESLRRGAWAVVVGTAITHPATITSWFVKATEKGGV